MSNIRNKLWHKIVKNRPPNIILPTRFVVVRWILFPLQTTRWYLEKREGYQIMYNTWIINDILISNEALYELSKSKGELYKIELQGKYLSIERVSHA